MKTPISIKRNEQGQISSVTINGEEREVHKANRHQGQDELEFGAEFAEMADTEIKHLFKDLYVAFDHYEGDVPTFSIDRIVAKGAGKAVVEITCHAYALGQYGKMHGKEFMAALVDAATNSPKVVLVTRPEEMENEWYSTCAVKVTAKTVQEAVEKAKATLRGIISSVMKSQ